jgi:hypothetical protein
LTLAAILASAGQVQAGTSVYGGVGATVAHFYAVNPHGGGKPPAGKFYYRVDATRQGRVETYHVVGHSNSKPGIVTLLGGHPGRGLPSDGQSIAHPNGDCWVYRSRWLGKVLFGLPRAHGRRIRHWAYEIVYISKHSGRVVGCGDREPRAEVSRLT